MPEEVRESLSNICFGIPGARWTQKDQMHLTVRFIGDTFQNTMDDIADILENVNCSCFSLTIKGLGYFPPKHKPNLLFAGIENSTYLQDLRDLIEPLLTEIGLEPEERKYHPHITLARLRPEAPLNTITGFLSAHNLLKIENIPITEFHLYSSELTADGAVHTKEISYSLL
jgi:2'-5' RNA ligase